MVRRYPQRTCFTYVNEAGEEASYSYREVRMLAAALARYLQSKGVQRGSYVSVDLPNCPLYVMLILAAAYGSFTLVAINNRLTLSEKLSRLLELERCLGTRVAFRVDEARAPGLLNHAAALLAGDARSKVAGERTTRPSFTLRSSVATATPRSTRGLGRATSIQAARRRRDEIERQDALEDSIHFAEHAAHVFDAKARALIMFTSGTTGKPKAVPLTWAQICRSAEASNAALNSPGVGMWQAALPLYHIGGFQVVLRSLLGQIPFILYRRFDAKRVLADAVRAHITHVSVVDKMLQDLLREDDAGTLKTYRCILLGGAAANPNTLKRCLLAGIRVYASYGMTETSSQIAHAQVTPSFNGGLRLLPGYEVRIVSPDAQGFGRLAVKGVGVFGGYLNAQATHTMDGFFLTGDTAALAGGRLYVKERTTDMFVSGGENIYPAEIRDKLLHVPGVAEAYVFGAPDAVWGRRPVAFVEREQAAGRPRMGRGAAQASSHQFAAEVRTSLTTRLSKLYQPRCLFALDEFPRTGIGKIDRAALEALYEERIEVLRVVLYRIRLPFKTPFKTAKGTLHDRESVIVEVTDHAGRTGLGECVAFPTDWYLPEMLDQDVRVLKEVLAPLVLNEVYLHPSEVSASFASCVETAAFPMAQGALEPALWDLYGKIVGKPLWQLIGGAPSAGSGAISAGGGTVSAGSTTASAGGGTMPGGNTLTSQVLVPAGAATNQVSVPAGAVVGMGTATETVEAVRRCVEAGYRRVKLKVAPGGATLTAVQAVRAAYPGLMITLDANQSFTERNLDELRALDACNPAWIEEPLNPRLLPGVGPTNLFDRLVRLQRSLRTPICLDESIVRPVDLARASEHSELNCYAIKIAKMGGVQPALDFVHMAQTRGIKIWMGGMYDTGISKRLHAAFETLPGITAPGDIGATARYFATDVTDPPYTVERGQVTLNRAGHPHGLGCGLNRAALASVLVDRTVIERPQNSRR